MHGLVLSDICCGRLLVQSTIIPAKGSKFARNLPTYAGVSDRASMIIQRGHDEKTPLSNQEI